MRQKAIWRTALENCTDETFSKKRQIKNLQELAVILGKERGCGKNNELCGFIQGLRCHIVNRRAK